MGGMRVRGKRSMASRGSRLLISALMIWSQFGPGISAQPGQVSFSQGTLNLIIGKAHILNFPTDVTRASMTNPDVASLVIISPRELLINAKSAGVTNLLVWDEENQKQVFDIEVKANIDQLAALVREIAPRDHIAVYPANDSVVIAGEVARPTTVAEVEKIASTFSPNVVNLLRVAEPAQIMLKVRFIEVNRTAIQNLGFDLALQGTRHIFAIQQPGQTSGLIDFKNEDAQVGQEINKTDFSKLYPLEYAEGSNFAFWGKRVFRHNGELTTAAPMITALQKKDLLRVLAEPNLMAKSGEEANFLAGGELPIPIVTANAVTVQFKEFGVRLNFRPDITEKGTIRLAVEPEVSTLDFSRAVTVAGIEVPGLKTRKAKTVVELNDGESMVIGGLLSQDTNKVTSKVPMAADLPVLGDLFKSHRYQKGETELLVLVSPSVVKPDTDIPMETLETSPELAPFVVPGRYPFADAQGGRFRDAYGMKRDSIWESETEADPFIRRKNQPSWQETEARRRETVFGTAESPVRISPYTGNSPGEHDPEYHSTLQKYELTTDDPNYTMIPSVLKERLWGRTGVADPKTDQHGLFESLGYNSPSW